jgi:hypothetical protein
MLNHGPFIAETDIVGGRIAISDQLGRTIEFKPSDIYDLEKIVRAIRLAINYRMQCDLAGNRPAEQAQLTNPITQHQEAHS